MSVRVISPGVLTTVQDAGRYGYQRSGIGTAGVMDRDAFRTANLLVGNTSGEAVLEMTLQGAELLFEDDAICTLTGAEMGAQLDGIPVQRYASFPVRKGQTLKLGMAVSGCRGYLAFAGGVDVPLVLGSRSTSVKTGLGGFEGRALRRGDLLPVPPADLEGFRKKTEIAPVYRKSILVHVIPGPQDDLFTEEGWKTFLSSVYRTGAESDRMGIRLQGPAIESRNGTDIISDGIVFGSVQVTRGGLPIVLMADHQTTGGYAKIATVISEDLPLLAQLLPGAEVRFEKTDIRRKQHKEEEMVHPVKRKAGSAHGWNGKKGSWKTTPGKTHAR